MSLPGPSNLGSYIGCKPHTHVSIFVVGCLGVGKSTLVQNILGKCPDRNYTPTVEVCSYYMEIQLDGLYFHLTITDIPEQTNIPLRNIVQPDSPNNCVILMYDITNQSSFDAAEQAWLDISQYNKQNSISLKYSSVILLGNKSDLRRRKVKHLKGFNFASCNDFTFMEISAKNDKDIHKVLSYALKSSVKSEKLLWAGRTTVQEGTNFRGDTDKWNNIPAGSHFSDESDGRGPLSIFTQIIQKWTGKLGCFG